MQIKKQTVALLLTFFRINYPPKKNAPAFQQMHQSFQKEENYLYIYITSFTSFTVRGTSGKAAATRLGA
jgi:hypothetical protein